MSMTTNRPELLGEQDFVAAFGTPPGPWTDGALAAIDALEAVGTSESGRWPRLRRGPRAEIPGITRHLVLARDNDRCTLCGWLWDLQLDHIVPWSANGSDFSENLRALCATCNYDRSNFRETYLPRVLPVTVVCDPCLTMHDDDSAIRNWHYRTTYWRWCPGCVYAPESSRRSWLETPTTVWCGTCTTVSWCDDLARIF